MKRTTVGIIGLALGIIIGIFGYVSLTPTPKSNTAPPDLQKTMQVYQQGYHDGSLATWSSGTDIAYKTRWHIDSSTMAYKLSNTPIYENLNH